MNNLQNLILLLGLLLVIGLTLVSALWLTARLMKHSLTTQNQSSQVLLSLLARERDHAQGLLNQLRSADLMTLNAMNYSTGQAPAASYSDEYVPTFDESLQYQQNLANGKFRQEGLSDDLAAAGWDSTLKYDPSRGDEPSDSEWASDAGGSPVVFG